MNWKKLYKILIVIINWIKGNKKLFDDLSKLIYEVQILISEIQELKDENAIIQTKLNKLADENKRVLKITRKTKL